jgi:hypothetical protein
MLGMYQQSEHDPSWTWVQEERENTLVERIHADNMVQKRGISSNKIDMVSSTRVIETMCGELVEELFWLVAGDSDIFRNLFLLF